LSYTYSDDDGVFLVRLARNTVDDYVQHKTKPPIPSGVSQTLMEKSGVFVTLKIRESRGYRLRGCIGRPYPNQPLIEATIDSAIDSSVNDPRFRPVVPDELESIVVELSVLTPPTKIEYQNPEELMQKVKVGRDGLIAIRGGWRGLLLPQVPVQYGWDVENYLEHTCMKAGLPEDQWKDPETEFMAFQAEIFGEIASRGNIIRNPRHEQC
jgi:uncharacterized protein (TIGR00296 family)